jgi:hypothetical protein
MAITQKSLDMLTEKSLKSVFGKDKHVQVIVQHKPTYNKQYFDSARNGKKPEASTKKLSGYAKKLYNIMTRGK